MQDSGQEMNPFGRERAWLIWQENRERACRLREEIRQGREDGSSTREQLLRCVEMIGLMTDNTIFLRIVQRALEARDRNPEESGGTAEENA